MFTELQKVTYTPTRPRVKRTVAAPYPEVLDHRCGNLKIRFYIAIGIFKIVKSWTYRLFHQIKMTVAMTISLYVTQLQVPASQSCFNCE
jgi:hypothetical protein